MSTLLAQLGQQRILFLVTVFCCACLAIHTFVSSHTLEIPFCDYLSFICTTKRHVDSISELYYLWCSTPFGSLRVTSVGHVWAGASNNGPHVDAYDRQ